MSDEQKSTMSEQEQEPEKKVVVLTEGHYNYLKKTIWAAESNLRKLKDRMVAHGADPHGEAVATVLLARYKLDEAVGQLHEEVKVKTQDKIAKLESEIAALEEKRKKLQESE